ncbi:MAG TPA: ABC transporter ATP-binding protein [Acetobacteraceae bacterium]|nr:ABC transporter ATP-binding protein [Acetobacteraceae bacterium]
MSEPILTARGVVQTFASAAPGGGGRGIVRAVDGVDLDVHEGETLGIVGESGSGKSTLARLLLSLAQPNAGTIAYRGTPIPALSRPQRRVYRRDVQAVFQDPAASLNPRMPVERILAHVILRHGLATRATLHGVIAAHLESVGLSPAASFMTRYPHQLSGGQQQRVAVARAMVLRPRLIIADEPLSSLDISVQTQLLAVMTELQQRTGVGFVIISHDLGAVESIADRVAVMYRGRIVESGPRVLAEPRHAYTKALLEAKLIPDPHLATLRGDIAENDTIGDLRRPAPGNEPVAPTVARQDAFSPHERNRRCDSTRSAMAP